MSWARIWVHLVFSTKNREPYLKSSELRKRIYNHIKENSEQKQIWIDTIGGFQEHVHCLILLGKDQSISQIAQLIKGEVSFWINKSQLIKYKFKWQDDYWAVSVSESHVRATRDYINSQEVHHGRVSFTDEVKAFMAKYGWKLIGDNAAKAGRMNDDSWSVG